MRRLDPSKPPYLSFCLIVRNSESKELGSLERCLRSVRARAPDAEIVIVDTMSSDATVDVAIRWADVFADYRGPRGDWTRTMDAFDDAAAARQYAFSLANGVWRAWIDDDDVLPDPDEAERLLRLNGALGDVPTGKSKLDAGGETPGEAITLEGLLHYLDAKHPEVEHLSAPYAYAFEVDPEHGVCSIWQPEKTRIVKWAPGKWKWSEAAHEDLVHVDPAEWKPPVPIARLPWVHMKRHDDRTADYSMRRHGDILLREYEAGRRTTRNCLYLANFAPFMWPGREREFLDCALACANMDADRSRALVAIGNWYAARGLNMECREAFGGAVQFRPDLPDAWAAGANAAVSFDDHRWAAEWWQRATLCKLSPDTLVNPREHALRYPILLAQSCSKLAAQQMRAGAHENALANYRAAAEAAATVARHPAAAPNLAEVQAFANARANDYHSHAQAIALHGVWEFLVRNDETQKALVLIRARPHTIEDHPLIIAMEMWGRGIANHLSNDAAYRAFYESPTTNTDVLPSDGAWLAPENCLPRAAMLGKWLEANRPTAHVLEVGAFDGVIGIPVLRACPGVKYTAVDASKPALDRFAERAVAHGVGDRLETFVGTDVDADTATRPPEMDVDGLPPAWAGRYYDAVVAFELIEHVPDPGRLVSRLLSMLKPDGVLFLSTPWGAYDRGVPPAQQSGHARDPRGHVRAMTVRDLRLAVEGGGGEVTHLTVSHATIERGDTMHAIARRARASAIPLSFYVAGALWDWNGSHVHATGIGASEETICYLAERLTESYRPTVYGPVPEPEVLLGVEYAPQAQVRHVLGGKIIVSRAPGAAAQIDALTHDSRPKILWLQDAYYADLNDKTAAQYERIVVLTEWHRAVLLESAKISAENAAKIVIIPNFILREHFAGAVAREPHRLIYASSHDRGLINLLRLWPDVLARWPDAKLDIFYGFDGARKLAAGQAPGWVPIYRALRHEYERLRYQSGVTDRGRVDHLTIAREFQRADAWSYPTLFSETFCTTAIKARAAGCVPVCTPLAGLNESAACPQSKYVPVSEGSDPLDAAWKARFLDGLDAAFATTTEERAKMSADAIAQYDIKAILPKWQSIILRGL